MEISDSEYLLTRLFEGGFPNYNRVNYGYSGKLRKSSSFYNYKQLISMIKSSKFYNVLLQEIRSLNEDILYDSDIHGYSHNVRVAILITGIAILEGVSLEDYIILIKSALYHDIGRINDDVDKDHGKRSAEMLSTLDIDISEEDKKYLELICLFHSIDDKYIEYEGHPGIDWRRLKILTKILKDADALDRIRISADCLNVNYLRTKAAISLVPATYELLANYKDIEKRSNYVLHN